MYNPESVLRNKELHREAHEESLLQGEDLHGWLWFKLGSEQGSE